MSNIADKFRLPSNLPDKPKKEESLKSVDHCGFIKGPIPLGWALKACELPGTALKVALALWYVYGLKKRNTFKLTSKTARRFSLSRKTKHAGLGYLESAGLIQIRQSKGKNPIITLLNGDKKYVNN
jgi:hypothetical protein